MVHISIEYQASLFMYVNVYEFVVSGRCHTSLVVSTIQYTMAVIGASFICMFYALFTIDIFTTGKLCFIKMYILHKPTT